ncbi:AAA family ATPase [Erwinia tasmaniensis]|uniref:AAA family ATPase n=1 Tax=Erwinia tasmaniensis TaxID=338565 RepID=UPI003A4D290A
MNPDALGPRICILGPSNSGKSTLATAIARKCERPIIHLDRLYHHYPHSSWCPRPADEFLALHEKAIAQESWIMEGNYSRSLPQRLDRATGVILLDISTASSLLRYIQRTLWQRGRYGGMDGQDRLSWEMLHHILFVTPGGRKRNAALFEQLRLPRVRAGSVKEIARLYVEWGLDTR